MFLIAIVLIVQDKYSNFFLLLFFLVVLIAVIHGIVFEAYSKVGLCSIDLHSIRLKNQSNLEDIEFSEILFIYGGYKGKDDGFNLFNYSNVKSGANNYLIFKKDTATKVQIMLNSKKEYQELLKKFSELDALGIKVEKVNYSIFEFRNIMKKIKLSK